eukprot:524493-Hanusia_phi.AAC.1
MTGCPRDSDGGQRAPRYPVRLRPARRPQAAPRRVTQAGSGPVIKVSVSVSVSIRGVVSVVSAWHGHQGKRNMGE